MITRSLEGGTSALEAPNVAPPPTPIHPLHRQPALDGFAISILHEALLEAFRARFDLARIRVHAGAGRECGEEEEDYETPAAKKP